MEQDLSTTKVSNVKIPEKIKNRLDELINNLGDLSNCIEAPVQRLGGLLPPQPEAALKGSNSFPELMGDCAFMDIVEKINCLDDIASTLRLYIGRLEELV